MADKNISLESLRGLDPKYSSPTSSEGLARFKPEPEPSSKRISMEDLRGLEPKYMQPAAMQEQPSSTMEQIAKEQRPEQ